MSSEQRSPTERPPEVEEELVPEDDRIIGRVFRWSLVVIGIGVLAVAGLVYWSRQRPADAPVVARGTIEAPAPLERGSAAMPQVAFKDVTAEAGIRFHHENGARGEKLLPETMGAGVAFLDYDGDGDADLLFVNSDTWPGQGGPHATQALFRNDSHGRFEDVTAESGLGLSLYGQGVAVGDYDGDGRTDVFLSALGPDRLLHNEGGRFRDVTAQAGVAGASDAWGTSAGFFDYDNDGDLDLFVCNYIRWSREIDLALAFTLNGRDRAYGPPKQYQGVHSYLYRNEGDGRFSDVSRASGIEVQNPATGEPMGKALGVVFIDADEDGDLDVFVANDTVQKFVFRNRGDGTFEEIGAASGVAFDTAGMATGAMGIDVADYGNTGALAVGVANFANEATSFYVQQKDPWQFVDMANSEGVGSPSRLKLKFGFFFFDYDLDGRLDILQANGHLENEINQIQPSQTYRQATQLFWNCGRGARGCYTVVPDDRLGDLGRPIVGRGAAYADIDADGDLDVALTDNGGSPLLIRNDQALGHHWLRVRLVGRAGNREAIGALLVLEAGGVVQRRQVMPTRSYLSQVELPVTFGLGASEHVDSLRVHWPGGAVQDVPVEAVDTVLTVEQQGG
jgi:hypothetical protein